MPDPEQRFELLAQQFKVLEQNLSVSRNAEQRMELLEGMNTVIVIEELDQLILANQSWLDSTLVGAVPTNYPCSKAAHQKAGLATPVQPPADSNYGEHPIRCRLQPVLI